MLEIVLKILNCGLLISFNIWQISVADFNCVPIYKFVEWMSFREVDVHKQEEFSPHICLNIVF